MRSTSLILTLALILGGCGKTEDTTAPSATDVDESSQPTNDDPSGDKEAEPADPTGDEVSKTLTPTESGAQSKKERKFASRMAQVLHDTLQHVEGGSDEERELIHETLKENDEEIAEILDTDLSELIRENNNPQ